MKCCFSFMPEPGSGQACGREVGVQFSFQVQASDNHAVRNWTFDFLSNSSLWQSCSQELNVLKLQQPPSFQFRLTFPAIRQPGIWSSFSFQVKISDNQAVRNWYAGFCNNHISLRILGTRVIRLLQPWAFLICLPWVVGLQGDRHLYRLIQAASTGVNLLLWRHLGTKAKERPMTMRFPHHRGPYVTLSTTVTCGEFWETFATGRTTSRQWKSFQAKWRLPIGTLCYWTNLLSRSS